VMRENRSMERARIYGSDPSPRYSHCSISRRVARNIYRREGRVYLGANIMGPSTCVINTLPIPAGAEQKNSSLQ